MLSDGGLDDIGSDLGGETLGNSISILLGISNSKVHSTEFVVKGDRFGRWEGASLSEELLDDPLGLVFLVIELVRDGDGCGVVLLDLVVSDSVVRGEHSSLEGASLCDTLNGVEGSHESFNLEGCLDLILNDGNSGGVTDQLD